MGSPLLAQVYVRVQPGDLNDSGTLLAGRQVDIKLTGDLTNSDTIAGRQVVMNNFDAAINGASGIVVSKVKVSPGIYEIKYQLPNGKEQSKTVYDPATYSDKQMADMATEAAGKAIIRWGSTGIKEQFVVVNGITFFAPISTRGNQLPHIPTVFPVDPSKVEK